MMPKAVAAASRAMTLRVGGKLVAAPEIDGAHAVGSGQPGDELAFGGFAHGENQRPITVIRLHAGEGLGIAGKHGLDGIEAELRPRPEDGGGRRAMRKVELLPGLPPAFAAFALDATAGDHQRQDRDRGRARLAIRDGLVLQQLLDARSLTLTSSVAM